MIGRDPNFWKNLGSRVKQHLLDLGTYAGVPILTIRDFLAQEFPEQVN